MTRTAPFAPRTPEMIGRKALLAEILTAVEEDSGQSYLFYLVGPGGSGKTRLLEEIDRLVQNRNASRLAGAGLIDLYHADYHSPGGLRTGLVEGLDPDGHYFRRFQAARQGLQEKRVAGLGGQALEQIRREVQETFQAEYHELATNKRLVLCFDTLELLGYGSEDAERLCDVQALDAGIFNWFQTVASQFKNTVIVVAGRPMPQVEKAFEKAFTTSGYLFRRRELGPFSLPETSAFLDVLADGDPRGLELHAILSAPGADQIRKQIYALSGGRPVYLTLIVDLLLSGLPLSEIFPVASNGASVQPDAVGRLLVERLLQLDAPLGLTIEYLIYARKGLDRALLHFLTRGAWTETLAGDVIERLALFAFVKKRTHQDGTVQLFLHDEVYDIFDLHFLEQREASRYAEIGRYFREQRHLLSQTKPRAAELESATTALLYYEFQTDARNGYYSCYVPWSEDAIRMHEVGLDMRLRDELLHFVNRYVRSDSRFFNNHLAARIDETVVRRDNALRWVQRLIARGEYKAAYETAQTVQKDVKATLDLENVQDTLYHAALLTSQSEAAVLMGRVDAETEADFLRAVELLQRRPKESELRRWRARILGVAYNQLGYLYRTRGNYGQALAHYRHALPHFRTAGTPSEQANTLTNMAFLQALLGRGDLAEANIAAALIIRRKLNAVYPLALSTNTQGIIFTLQSHPDWGARECRRALDLCRDIGEKRGEGLALIGLGLALRHQGKLWEGGHCTSEEASGYFRRAQEALEQAIQIFNSQIREPIRLWEAYSESGSLYHAWGWMEQQNDQLKIAKALYSRAIRFHGMALGIAERSQFQFQVNDSLDDLAQVYGDRSFLFITLQENEQADQSRRIARQYVDTVFEKVPTAFQLKPGTGFEETEQPGETHWQALAKAHQWQGTWLFRDLQLGRVPIQDRTRILEEATQHFITSIIYSQHYWPASLALQRCMKVFFSYLRQNRVSAAWVYMQIRRVGRRYRIELPMLEETVGDMLGA